MNQVDRVHSGRHINDQSVYHSDESDDDEASFEGGNTPDTTQEVRNGIVNERDLDLEKSQQPQLEKTRTAKSNRSRHDSKLVSFHHYRRHELEIVINGNRSHGMVRMTQRTPKTGA